jgi:hypothetical protein
VPTGCLPSPIRMKDQATKQRSLLTSRTTQRVAIGYFLKRARPALCAQSVTSRTTQRVAIGYFLKRARPALCAQYWSR